MKTLFLLISIAVILLLIRRFHVGFAVLVGSLVLGFLSMGLNSLNVLMSTITSLQTLKFLVIVTLAFSLAHSLNESGALDEITKSSTSVFGRSSLFVIPALIGFLPMPGGAIVSAVMLKDVVRMYGVDSDKVTFLNYWFRHVWAGIDPIYPSVILTLAIIEIDYPTLLKATYPITLAMITAGLPFAEFGRLDGKRYFKGFLYLLPIFLVIVLTVLGIDLVFSLSIALTSFYAFKRVDFRKVIKKAIDPKIMLLLISLLYYKNLIILTNSSQELLSNLHSIGIPRSFSAFILSFLLGFATGIESGYAALALPLLTPFTGVREVVGKNLLLVVSGGIIGVMLSPLHLCLILTREYYSSNLEAVYIKYLIPSAVLTLAVISLLYLF